MRLRWSILILATILGVALLLAAPRAAAACVLARQIGFEQAVRDANAVAVVRLVGRAAPAFVRSA